MQKPKIMQKRKIMQKPKIMQKRKIMQKHNSNKNITLTKTFLIPRNVFAVIVYRIFKV